MAKNVKNLRRARLRRGIRARIQGTAERPRLCVFRSNTVMYAQVIDDGLGRTLAAASTRKNDVGDAKGTPVELSRAAGRVLADRLKEVGIQRVVFDRNTYRYHGRVKALAEGVREGGIQV
ncbi:MAG: 50S ribosomal protein L18 [Rhodothermales bacterium]